MEATIKILIDAHVVTAGYQGTHTFLTGLYNAMYQRHPTAVLFFVTTDKEGLKKNFPFADDEHIFVIPRRRPAILRLWFDIPRLLKKHAFDFAHFQYISPRKTSNCRTIVTTHDILFNDYPAQFSWFYRSSRNLLFKRSICRADIKTTVSQYSRQRISSYYGISEADIMVLPNAVAGYSENDMSKAEARLFVKKQYGIENFILYVSRIEPRKNHLLLLTAYLRLALWKKGIPLVFVGKKSIAVPAVEKLLRTLTPVQRSHIYFFDELSNTELAALYKSCRLFVYPSVAEGFGIPPLEAAVCHAPVLCSSATAMQQFEFFMPYMFDPADGAAFETQLANMLASPPTADFLMQTANVVEDMYNWNRTADAFFRLLKEKGGKTA
jgi:glycosyltransferase involved in cell wall biosynthesis